MPVELFPGRVCFVWCSLRRPRGFTLKSAVFTRADCNASAQVLTSLSSMEGCSFHDYSEGTPVVRQSLDICANFGAIFLVDDCQLWIRHHKASHFFSAGGQEHGVARLVQCVCLYVWLPYMERERGRGVSQPASQKCFFVIK